MLAYCYLRLEKFQECRRVVDEIFDADPDAPYGHLISGYLAFRSGKSDLALRELTTARHADATFPMLYQYIGAVYLQQKQWQAAEVVFRQILEADGDDAGALHGLAWALFQQGRRDEAIDALQDSVALAHHQPHAHYHLGWMLAQIGQRSPALRALRMSLAQDPDATSLWRPAGRTQSFCESLVQARTRPLLAGPARA